MHSVVAISRSRIWWSCFRPAKQISNESSLSLVRFATETVLKSIGKIVSFMVIPVSVHRLAMYPCQTLHHLILRLSVEALSALRSRFHLSAKRRAPEPFVVSIYPINESVLELRNELEIHASLHELESGFFSDSCSLTRAHFLNGSALKRLLAS